MSQSLAKLLDPFRDNESASQLATVVDSPEAIRVLAAWTSTRQQWNKAAGQMPKAPDLRWAWLWRGVKFDHDALAAASRIAAEQTYDVLRSLVAARVVYPDGTISQFAAELVDAYVAKKMIGHGRKKESDALSRACPTCDAAIGVRCFMESGETYRRDFSHIARRSDEPK